MYDEEEYAIYEGTFKEEDHRPIAFCGRYETHYRVPSIDARGATVVVKEIHPYQR